MDPAYLTALVVMLFTAISYGKMVRIYSSAGSAYTYTRETMHPGLGFMVGWAALLDYLLLPMVNALIIRIYMVALFPACRRGSGSSCMSPGSPLFVAGFVGQAVFPDVSGFEVTDDTLPEMALKVGGDVFRIVFMSGAFFGYVHHRFHTPICAVVIVGVVSLLAVSPSLELISSMINFGALIAFTFVNLSVIAYLVFRKKRYKSPGDLFSYLLMPLIGAGMTGVLWAHLHFDALLSGIVWSAVGFLYLIFLTRRFRRSIAEFDMEEVSTSEHAVSEGAQ